MYYNHESVLSTTFCIHKYANILLYFLSLDSDNDFNENIRFEYSSRRHHNNENIKHG